MAKRCFAVTVTACDASSVNVLSRTECSSLTTALLTFTEELTSGRDYAAEGYDPLRWGVFLSLRTRSGKVIRRMQIN